MAIHSEPRAFQYPSANEYTKLNSEFLDNILYQVTRNKGLASLGLSHAPFPLNDLLLDSTKLLVGAEIKGDLLFGM